MLNIWNNEGGGWSSLKDNSQELTVAKLHGLTKALTIKSFLLASYSNLNTLLFGCNFLYVLYKFIIN